MLLEITTPFIMIIGLVGNLINYMVFNSKKMKDSRTFKLLGYLSAVDFLYLFIGIPHIMIIIYAKIDFRNMSSIVCSLHSFFTIFLSHLSSNLLAVTNVVRCIDIITIKPKKLKQPKLFNMRKSKIIFLVVMCLLILVNSHFIVFMRLIEINDFENQSNQSVSPQCYPSKSDQPMYFYFYTKIWPTIDLFMYSYIPFILMISSTIAIMFKLYQTNQKLKDKNKNKENSKEFTEMDSIVNDNRYRERLKSAYDEHKKRTRRNNQIYKLLLSINIAFFVLVTPLVMVNSFKIDENNSFFDLVYILAYSNHCCNFVFYGLSCKLFRKILKSFFTK
jgi:hypothetical protein